MKLGSVGDVPLLAIPFWLLHQRADKNAVPGPLLYNESNQTSGFLHYFSTFILKHCLFSQGKAALDQPLLQVVERFDSPQFTFFWDETDLSSSFSDSLVIELRGACRRLCFILRVSTTHPGLPMQGLGPWPPPNWALAISGYVMWVFPGRCHAEALRHGGWWHELS